MNTVNSKRSPLCDAILKILPEKQGASFTNKWMHQRLTESNVDCRPIDVSWAIRDLQAMGYVANQGYNRLTNLRYWKQIKFAASEEFQSPQSYADLNAELHKLAQLQPAHQPLLKHTVGVIERMRHNLQEGAQQLMEKDQQLEDLRQAKDQLEKSAALREAECMQGINSLRVQVAELSDKNRQLGRKLLLLSEEGILALVRQLGITLEKQS